MKIMYVVSTLESCGPINVLYNIIKYIGSEYEKTIITLSPEPINSKKELFENEGCKIISLNNGRLTGIFKNSQEVKKMIEKENPDVIHSHGYRADILISRVNHEKKITTIHNYPYDDYVLAYGRVLGYYMAHKQMKHIGYFSKVIPCSFTIANQIKNKSKSDISVIQNGVDLEKFNYDKDLQLQEKGNYRFIVVGSLIQRKNPLLITEAVRILADNNWINIEIIFLGDGPLMEQVVEKSADLNIKFLGNVNNVSEYLQTADYYISASKAEGLPNTVLEAMAMSIPCIISDINPHKELSIGDSAILFDKDSPEELAEKMIYAIENKIQAEEKAIRARRNIEKKLNAKEMACMYEKIYFAKDGD